MHYDVIVVGGSFAGLSAALYLGRARRSVCVIDTGQPRNRFADHSHGFFTQDGSEPGAMLATARAQVDAYPTVVFIREEAVDAWQEAGSIFVALGTGEVLTSSRLLLAFGISDVLPDVPGLADRWGTSVIHCPYCHGYEFAGQRLGVLTTSPMSPHQAILISEWGPTTLFLNGEAALDETLLRRLELRNIGIEQAPVEALIGDELNLSKIQFSDGGSHAVDALFVAPPNYLNSTIASRLGCEIKRAPLGSIVQVDEFKMTSIANVYAAGDITREGHNVTFACADGVMAAMAIHGSLVFDVPGVRA